MEAGKLGILAWLFLGMFCAFAAVTLFKLLPQLTKGRGLLIAERGGQIKPERVQAVAITMATLALLGFWGGQEAAANSGSLPDIPMELLVAFGVSQGTFVGGKWLRKKGFI